MDIKCKKCGKTPDQLAEYITAAKAEHMTPDDYVIWNEGTFNPKTGLFYCTSCYVKVGMPLGKV